MTQRGGAVVEFALVVPLVLVLLLAVVEVGLVARTQLEVVQAAREGAREAATSPDPARAVAAARVVVGPEARVTVRRPAVVGRMARVTVVLPHRIRLPLVGAWTVEVRATAAMRVER